MAQIKERKCLGFRCNNLVQSTWSGHRMCHKCRHRDTLFDKYFLRIATPGRADRWRKPMHESLYSGER